MRRVRTAGALVIALSALTACGVTKTGSPPSPTASTTSSSPTPTTTTPGRPADTPGPIPADLAPIPKRPTPLPATATCQYPVSTEPAAKPAQPPAGDNIPAEGTVDATISTRNGSLKIKLDRALAPCTVNSFINLAKQGFYNNTRCHRLTTVDSLQVLQCGDPLGVGTGGPGYTFADEVFPELTYGRGHLAMANSGPNTNGSQFFIVYGAARLPPNYTVFGSLDAPSMGAIDQIARAGTVSENSPGDGAPRIPVTIEQVEVAG